MARFPTFLKSEQDTMINIISYKFYLKTFTEVPTGYFRKYQLSLRSTLAVNPKEELKIKFSFIKYDDSTEGMIVFSFHSKSISDFTMCKLFWSAIQVKQLRWADSSFLRNDWTIVQNLNFSPRHLTDQPWTNPHTYNRNHHRSRINPIWIWGTKWLFCSQP